MTLLIDNYDSFSYNLYQLVGEMDPDITVIRNDEMTVEEIRCLAPARIILSPGPGRPEDAGILIEAVKMLGREIPILGVCLGHQAICEAFGGRIVHAKHLMHGKKSRVLLTPDCPVFDGLPKELEVARYHSLIAERETLPSVLQITAEDQAGEIMAVRHVSQPVFGLQFHPESILTPQGNQMLQNFLRI